MITNGLYKRFGGVNGYDQPSVHHEPAYVATWIRSQEFWRPNRAHVPGIERVGADLTGPGVGTGGRYGPAGSRGATGRAAEFAQARDEQGGGGGADQARAPGLAALARLIQGRRR